MFCFNFFKREQKTKILQKNKFKNYFFSNFSDPSKTLLFIYFLSIYCEIDEFNIILTYLLVKKELLLSNIIH